MTSLEVILYHMGTDTELTLKDDQQYLIFEHYPQEAFSWGGAHLLLEFAPVFCSYDEAFQPGV